MDIVEATRRYENWLHDHTEVVKADLQCKHELMAKSAFTFLRATFYRWPQLFQKLCPDAAGAPVIVAVGDLHVENFGTWRDAEGRLIWGINDFDEAYPLPYTSDLIRLATSVHLASKEDHFRTPSRDACALLLQGYRDGLKARGRPYVLDELHPSLRDIALGELRDPAAFWQKLRGLPKVRSTLSPEVRNALESKLPDRSLAYSVVRRQAGAGSLGRQRLVALAEWRGGPIAREIKAAVPSACTLVTQRHENGSFFSQLLNSPNRVSDPFLEVRDRWVVRRLAPDCSKIELANLPKRRDEEHLLHAMGFETANIHFADARAALKIQADLDRRKPRWLHLSARTMARALRDEMNEWRGAMSGYSLRASSSA